MHSAALVGNHLSDPGRRRLDLGNASYILNPRVTASEVGDAGNVRKSKAYYLPVSQNSPVALYGLVSAVEVLDRNDNVLKRAETDYNLSSAYTDRRIIGLPAETRVYGIENSSLVLAARSGYTYDEGDFSDTTLEQNIANVIMHDTPNYGASFTVGRGNLTTSTRYDVTGQTAAVSSHIKYNIAGTPVARITPWTTSSTRTVRIGYADAFNDTPANRNTYAYPTRVYDPAGNYSEVRYRYDSGANVWAKSPAPAGNATGKETAREYDSAGRLLKDSVLNNGAYTRYEYPSNNIRSKVFATLVDTDNDGADADDETMAESWTDGAGRVRRSRTEHPGSTGGWAATLAEYDILGQVKRSTVPTEVSVGDPNDPATWTPAGDDDRGTDPNGRPVWLWNSTEYDWKGRVTRTVPTDSNGSDGKDQLIGYEGCGCAGGQVTTVQGPLVPRDDDPNQTARRTQKVYDDILGRTWKTEVLDWSGNVYTTTVQTFNGRDQVTGSTRYAGATSSTEYRTVTAGFDGFGRLRTSHRPEQRDSNGSPTVTEYFYNPDDSVASIVDGRGVAVNYDYNIAGSLTSIQYIAPANSNIEAAPAVSFARDALGNATQMTDGLGTVTFEYDSLSRLTAETRQFADTLSNAPPNNRFAIEYSYSLAGSLRSIKDLYGQQFNYSADRTGRLASIVGATSFDGLTTYANSASYDARGRLTALAYGNGVEMTVSSFNNRLQATGFEVRKGTATLVSKEYEYYNDGSLKFSGDGIDGKFDRLYRYDFLGRTTVTKSGAPARGGTDDAINIPYSMNYTHDAFGHITQFSGSYYNTPHVSNYTFDNTGRNPQWSYDAEGNVTTDEEASYTVDAAGRLVKTTAFDPDTGLPMPPTRDWFDGNGRLAKRVKNFGSTDPAPQANYYLRSSVTGAVRTETDHTGRKLKTFVPANGATFAEQEMVRIGGTTTEKLTFIHQDPSLASLERTDRNGNVANLRAGEYDALGRNVSDPGPYLTLNTVQPAGDQGSSGINLDGSP